MNRTLKPSTTRNRWTDSLVVGVGCWIGFYKDRMMRKYRVVLNGVNFWLTLDDQPQRLGFYTTRFVEADNVEMAENHAVQLIRDDPNLFPLVLNEQSDPPMVYVEDIEEIDSFEGAGELNTGYTFYPDEDAAQ